MMHGGVLRRIRGLVSGSQSRLPTEEAEPDKVGAPLLYTGSDCEKTHISKAMDVCPDCRGEVREIPSERTLGFDSSAR